MTDDDDLGPIKTWTDGTAVYYEFWIKTMIREIEGGKAAFYDVPIKTMVRHISDDDET